MSRPSPDPCRYDLCSEVGASLGQRGACRFLLGRSGSRPLISIGLNPSTASRERSDATMTRVETVARRHGFEGFLMLNLCPLRRTDWRALPQELEGWAFGANLERIEAVVAARPGTVLWAAWGEGIQRRPYLIASARALIERLEPWAPVWRHFGPLTRAGHPRHPSRLDYGWAFARFDALAYRRRLGG